jgi:hypothetical protein
LDSRLFIAVLGLALLDSLNPMLFAGELYVLRGAHPERRAFAFIAGVFVVMVVGGVLLAGGLTQWVATYFSRLPDGVWLQAQVALGLGLVLFGLSYRTQAEVRAGWSVANQCKTWFSLGALVFDTLFGNSAYYRRLHTNQQFPIVYRKQWRGSVLSDWQVSYTSSGAV